MKDTSRFDRFEILAPLGVGGMGEVVKARAVGAHGFEKIVAIKRIRADWAEQEEMSKRFVREARIAARLDHANIVQVFDFGRHDDELFLVMEFVDGHSLDAIVATLAQNGKRPSVAQTLQVALDVARALESAHSLDEGVVHRDVSPANIMISKKGVVKLADFGIASLVAQQERTSSVAGKPYYMAPEQLRGDSLDGRADLFALGIVMYEMLTGERPWKGMVDAAPDATLESMRYRPPSELATEIPEQVDELVTKLVSPVRDERFASAAALARAIVKVSYACQIVLDSAELRPMVVAREEVAHAPTLPSNPTNLETLVATGVSPDGATMLAKEAADGPPRSDEAPATRTPAWVWAALLLATIGGGAVAWALVADSSDADPTAALGSAPQTVEVEEIVGAEAEAEALPEAEAGAEAGLGAEAETPSGEGGEAGALPVAETGAEALPEAEVAAAAAGRRAPRRRVPRRVAEPVGEPGTLDVFSSPWAEIYIDGVRQAQNAPARGLRVPSGRRRVRLVNPYLGRSAERTVVVPAGGRAQLRVYLNEEAPAAEE